MAEGHVTRHLVVPSLEKYVAVRIRILTLVFQVNPVVALRVVMVVFKMLAKNRGFTLIELLLVIAVGAILFTVGLARYNDFNKRQTVKQAAFNLRNDLQSAKTKAFTGNKSSCATLDRYRVSFTANNYQTNAVCVSPAGSGTTTTVPLPAGVSISNSPQPIEFKILGQGVETQRTICLFGFNLYYKIIVTTTGEIQDGGFVTSCS